MQELSSEEIPVVTKSLGSNQRNEVGNRRNAITQDFGESWKRWPILVLYTLFNVNIAFQVNNFWCLTVFSSEVRVINQKVSGRNYNNSVKLFMFQPISPMVAEFYNTSDEVIIWLTQMSLVIFVVVLFPVAFLSDVVSVRRKSFCFFEL